MNNEYKKNMMVKYWKIFFWFWLLLECCVVDNVVVIIFEGYLIFRDIDFLNNKDV